jgi:hypothetical protein
MSAGLSCGRSIVSVNLLSLPVNSKGTWESRIVHRWERRRSCGGTCYEYPRDRRYVQATSAIPSFVTVVRIFCRIVSLLSLTTIQSLTATPLQKTSLTPWGRRHNENPGGLFQ